MVRLAGASHAALADARDQLHHVAAVVAAASRLILPPADDDSHTSLRWRDGTFETAPLDDVGTRAILDLSGAALRLEGGNAMALGLAGRTWSELFAAVTDALGDGAPPLTPDARYELPPHAVGSGAPFTLRPGDAAAADLSTWYGLAAAEIAPLGDGPLALWPHHFDLAALLTLPDDGSGGTRTIGTGASPGDESIPQPYLYVGPWPYPPLDELPELAVGHWHTGGWVGAALTYDDVRGHDDQAARIRAFLAPARTALQRLLGA